MASPDVFSFGIKNFLSGGKSGRPLGIYPFANSPGKSSRGATSQDYRNDNMTSYIKRKAAAGGGDGGAQTQSIDDGGAAAARQENMSLIERARQGIESSAGDAFKSFFNTYDTTGRGLIDQIRQAQQAIDRSRQNIELGKLNNLSGINESIRTGVQSGMTKLANMGGSGGSAERMLGHAYGKIGTNQRSDTFNEAALGQRDQDFAQEDLALQETEGVRQLSVMKDEEGRRIGSDVENKLLALDERAAGLGLQGTIEVEGLRKQIVQEGIARLKEVDDFVNTRLSEINPMAQEAWQAEAAKLRTLGRPEGGFGFGDLTASNPLEVGAIPLLARRPEEE